MNTEIGVENTGTIVANQQAGVSQIEAGEGMNQHVRMNPNLARLNKPAPYKKPRFDATFLVAKHRMCRFDTLPVTKESIDLIRSCGISIKGLRDFGDDAMCVPIKITSRNDEHQPTQDWTRYGSVISQLEYNNVIRWWPTAAFSMTTKLGQDEIVRIEYPDFIIEGLVRYAFSAEEQQYFKDIVLPRDKPKEEQLTTKSLMTPGREIEEIPGTVKTRESPTSNTSEEKDNMSIFNSKDKNKQPVVIKPTISEFDEPVAARFGEPPISDTQRRRGEEAAKTIARSKANAEELKKPSDPVVSKKKPIPTWAKIAIGVTSAAAVTGVVIHVLKKNYVIV